MEGVAWRYGRRGAPILPDGLGFFECALCADVAAGDHRVVLGQVIDGVVLSAAGVPLAYADTHNLDRSAELYPASF
jgi:flavin reductase (DIM6/NTAB) family NADH-FMN oxidoreductase RutF